MEGKGYEVFPISAATREGIESLFRHVANRLDEIVEEPIYEEEETFKYYTIDDQEKNQIIVRRENDYYVVEGKPVEKLMYSTNLSDMDSLRYFQNFLRKRGIVDELKALGIQDGDTVKIYDFEFEYYD